MKPAKMLERLRKKVPNFGFTLVELIVVITILAILATIGFLTLSGYSSDAKSATVAANLRSVMTAISSESAITWNSPRYYVVHDTGAALSGAVAYFDGNPTTFIWGNWDAKGTNYSAGNPNYANLKLNPDKFKISIAPLLPTVFAAYNWKDVSVGALEVSENNGVKKRSTAYFQVAGVDPGTNKASVVGTFPTTLSGSVSGLVKDPSSSSATGTLLEGVTIGTVSAPAQNIGTIAQLTYGMVSPGYAFTSTSHAAGKTGAFANVGINKGKWYFEATLDDNYTAGQYAVYDIGFSNKPSSQIADNWFAEGALTDAFGGYVHWNSAVFCSYTHCGTNMANVGSVITGFTSWGVGNVLGIAVDADAKTVAWYRNGVLAWTTTGITTPTPWYPGIGGVFAPTATGVRFNFGQSAFAYPVPSGYNSGLWTAAQ